MEHDGGGRDDREVGKGGRRARAERTPAAATVKTSVEGLGAHQQVGHTISIGTAGGSGLGVAVQDLTRSLLAFVRAALEARPRAANDAAVDGVAGRDPDALPPQFILGLAVFAIVLSSIVTLVLVTSLQNA